MRLPRYSKSEEQNVTTATQTWTEETVEAAGTTVQVVKGGAGRP